MNNAYQDFLGQRTLGDRAMKQKDYRKAIQHYEEALSVYNSPGSKRDSVIQALAEAKNHLGATISNDTRSPTLIEDGVFKPSSVWIRLFANEQLQEQQWKELASQVFRSCVDSDERLRAIMFSVDDVMIQKSYQFVRHDGAGFLHVAMKTASNWMVARCKEEKSKWCTTFAKDGTLAPQAGFSPTQIAIFVVIFGSEKISTVVQEESTVPRKWWQFRNKK